MIRVIAEECAQKGDFLDKISHIGPGGALVLIAIIIAIAIVVVLVTA